MTPEERYAMIVDALIGSSDAALGISEKKGFGSTGLSIGGKLFAMLNKGRLVVKLPRQRVDAIIASGDGERFDPGHGRLMKEWVSVAPTSHEDWLAIAKEAMGVVASRRRSES